MAADPYKYFRVEAREIIAGLGKGLLDVEKGDEAQSGIAHLLRLAHTLKGAARVVRQVEIAELAHALEDTLVPVRDGQAVLTRDRIETALKVVDAISIKARALDAPVPAPVDAPKGTSTVGKPTEEPLQVLHTDAEQIDALLDGVAEANFQMSALRRSMQALERASDLVELLTESVRTTGAEADAAKRAPLRGTTEELQGLVNRLSRELTFGMEQLERELRQVGTTAEQLRLVPAGLMFNTLERAARDAGLSLGKRVNVEVHGADVRLDADVLALVQRALVQAVSNAMAHGIETEAERAGAGKPAHGTIRVEVARHDRGVAFTCKDDGRGVNFEAVRRMAQQRSLAADAQALDEQALLRLLLGGGISTSKTVTNVSGRGVGLDVVRETAERLGGEATLRTEAGRGTTLSIIVPVSRSAVRALLVEAGGEVAAIPLGAVRRAIRITSADVSRTAEGDSVLVDGKVIPFFPLSRSLNVGAQVPSGARAWSAVLVEGNNAIAAVGVDRLLGTESVVARTLPEGMAASEAVAGAMLDAQGTPRMVLDPDGLVRIAAGSREAEPAVTARRAPILVIDDSLTTRMLEQSILESAGYEVDVATSGEEGLERAALKQYSLFLVDVEMPGIDGFTFVERTRADETLRKVPAILVTSRNAPADRQRGERAGASAYIVKGEFDQTELLARIRKLVG